MLAKKNYWFKKKVSILVFKINLNHYDFRRCLRINKIIEKGLKYKVIILKSVLKRFEKNKKRDVIQKK